MSSGASSRRSESFRPRPNSLSKKNELESHRELSETTNRPRVFTAKFKKDNLASQYTNMAAYLPSPYHQSDQFSKDGPRKALLSSDWRQRPSGALHQVNNVENYDFEPQPYQVEKIDSNMHGKHLQDQDSTSAKENSPKSASELEIISQGPSKTSHDNSKRNDRDRGDGKDPRKSSNKPRDRGSPGLVLGPKYLTKLERLYGPTSHGDTNTLSSAISRAHHTDATELFSGTHNNFGLALVSKADFSHCPYPPSGLTMKPMIQLQQVASLSGLRSIPWSNLDRRRYNEYMANQVLLANTTRQRTASIDSRLKTGQSNDPCAESWKGESAEDKRFKNMLAKLKAGKAQRMEDSQASHVTHGPEHASCRSSSSTGKSSRKDSSSASNNLNPRAPSFFSMPQNQKPATYHGRSHTTNPRPELSALFDGPSSESTTDVLFASPRRRTSSLLGSNHVSDSLLSLAEKIKRAAQDSQQIEQLTGAPPTDAQVQAIMRRLGIKSLNSHIKPDVQLTSPADFESGDQAIPLDRQPSLIQGWSQRAGVGFHPSSVSSTTTTGGSQMSSLPNFGLSHSQAINLLPPLPVDCPVVNGRVAGHIPGSLPPQIMPQNNGSYQQSRPSMKEIMEGIETEVRANPFAGCPEASKLLGPSFIHLPGLPPTVIGPKPVMKPKGPPRPHDPL
ncbi:hypothetical protein PFICI_06043 [Pestalotiopsis fici W106-1]|uniref:Uncharacterized protein n=1 Tax=Pestalotiopsis fici (strain W106-1 / CGMCC3.15140) TaxID=1229662 RepID=W3X785_PESFW|nr:uncharacterized protein PFICI_06043 [Pestalotiopsis fici W106-1]ETS81041.1 hypothetical protein PFICI_06043 [Pestalotiopsis fici W106-1]